MKNRIICVVACMMMLVSCLILSGCNKTVIDTTYYYSWAQLKMPDGSIVEGSIDKWCDYEGDQLQVTIDGVTYLVHASNVVLKA